jgi:hypothetical protein
MGGVMTITVRHVPPGSRRDARPAMGWQAGFDLARADSNRIVTDLGMGRCEPAVGDGSPPQGPRQRAPFLRSSWSRAFVISARPNLAGGFGPRSPLSTCL